jgi:hypothetical protein
MSTKGKEKKTYTLEEIVKDVNYKTKAKTIEERKAKEYDNQPRDEN